MGKDGNIIDLAKYRQKGQSDLKTMIQIHDHILTIEDEELRKEAEEAWRKAAIVLICELQP